MPVLPGTDLDVFPISLGAGDFGTRIKGEDLNRLIDRYAEAGGNFLDTAHVYAAWVPNGEGLSERAIGDWLRHSGARQRTIISTKGGHPPMDGYPHNPDYLSLPSLQEDVAESLERLGTDTIDLYYLHRDDGKTPVGEVIDALNEIPALRYLGASNWRVERVAEANVYAQRTGKKGFVALQSQWSLAVPNWNPGPDPVNRFITDSDRDWCAAQGVTVHAYSATANGYFAKEQDDGTYAGNAQRKQRARELASKMGKTPTQIALGWLLSQPGSVIPIIGTTKPERLQEALGAVGLELDGEACKWVRE